MAAPLPRAVTSIKVADTSTGLNGYTFAVRHVQAPTLEDIRSEVETGDRLNRRFGFRKIVRWTSYINGTAAFGSFTATQDLYAASLAGTEKELTIVYDGSANNTFVYDPVLLTVRPLMALNNKKKLWIHDAGSGVPTTGYSDVGAFLAASPEFVVELSGELGDGRQCYVRTRMEMSVPLKDVSQVSTIEGKAGDLKVALDLGDSTYFTMDEVIYDVEYMDQDPLVVAMLHLTGAWQDPRDGSGGLAWPASPADNFFGFEVTAYAAGMARADVLTVS
ncbi:MAG: hypothetical protein ACR2RL_05180 [Gammaproteobacteria bacterium]